jgi:hypothetical protein
MMTHLQRVVRTVAACSSLLLSISLPHTTEAVVHCSARSGAHVMPLVELYTSEGCSSCPPADRWLSQNIRSQGTHQTDSANWLAFHVDYWDDLGWPDRFASAVFTQRQRQRVGVHGDSTVYTPQVMLGERVRMSWRGEAMFSRALAEARTPARVGLALSMQSEAGQWVLRLGSARVAGFTRAASVWVAESVDGQITDVRAGENGGVRLRHDRVVRKLWGPWPLAKAPLMQRIAIPASSSASDFTAFVEDEQGRTLQSLRLVGGCDG